MPHPVYTQMSTTVFEEMSGLARANGAVNLGVPPRFTIKPAT